MTADAQLTTSTRTVKRGPQANARELASTSASSAPA